MSKALIDVLTDKGELTGEKKSKVEVHMKGLWHGASWVWLYNSQGDILFQKRSKNKDSHPGLWDISAAGHVDSGETPLDAAVRELEEEIGINLHPEELNHVETRVVSKYNPDNKWQNNEFAHTYLYRWDGDPKTLRLQVSEVESMQFIPIEKLIADLKNSEKVKKYVGHGKYYKDVIDAVRKALE